MLELDPRAQGFLSAAQRHLRDAEHLLRAPVPDRSVDQAYYLAGYGPECVRKAAVPASTYDQAMGHGVGESSEVALAYALATNVSAHRYELTQWYQRYPALTKWNETARYRRSGTFSEDQARDLLQQASDVVDAVTYALWADDVVPESFRW
jgi:hypothetical protein